MPSLRVGVTLRDGLFAGVLGLVGAAAFPPLGLWPLSLVAVAGLLWLLRGHDVEAAMNLGLLYGLAYGLGTIWWFALIFGPMIVGLLALFGIYFGILGMLIGMTKGRSPLARALFHSNFLVLLREGPFNP